MATGDKNDMLARVQAALPAGWFEGPTIINAVLSGFASAMAWLYSMYQYVQLQTRITTATGAWLDIAAQDFFGTGLPRMTNELDAQYRARIKAALFVEQGTRNAIYYTLLRLTGQAPTIFEPSRPADTGAYMGASGTPMGLAYGMAGGYGSLMMQYQALVTAYLPSSAGIANVAPYGVVNFPSGGYGYPIDGGFIPMQPVGAYGAYNTPSMLEYASLVNAQQNAALAAVYNAVDASKPAGTIIWVGTLNNPPPSPAFIGMNFAIGQSAIH